MTGRQLTEWMTANRITRRQLCQALQISPRTATNYRVKGTPYHVDLAIERAFVIPGVLAEARRLNRTRDGDEMEG